MATDPEPVLPPATLGVVGGGQLGRFFVAAAHELGYEVWVLDPDSDSPAGRIADHHLVAAYDDQSALDRFADACRAVTTEFESVPAATLEHLARVTIVRPHAEAVAVCQDRMAEKAFLRDHGFPHAPYVPLHEEADLAAAGDQHFPGLVKVARFGYDGKGQARVASREDALAAFLRFGAEPCVLEAELPLETELSVVLTRAGDGEVRCFPTVENRHIGGILDTTVSPARVGAERGAEAEAIAGRVAEALDYVGTVAVELFVTGDRLVVNEIAPRPHNSGHVTLDSCVTDQFEQQVRALCGLPLADPRPHSAGVMVNLLGDLWSDGGRRQPDWSVLHRFPDLRLHLYGKREARPGRKMGHFTVVGDDLGTVVEVAAAARSAIGIGDTGGGDGSKGRVEAAMAVEQGT